MVLLLTLVILSGTVSGFYALTLRHRPHLVTLALNVRGVLPCVGQHRFGGRAAVPRCLKFSLIISNIKFQECVKFAV